MTMEIEGAEWARCTPEWVARYNQCGETIRQPTWLEPVALPIGHEHLMARGNPVLWTDALFGQYDRLQLENGERITLAAEDKEPF